MRGVGCEAWVCPWGPTVAPRYQQAGKSGKAQAQSQALTHRPRSPAGGLRPESLPQPEPPLGPIVVSDAGAGNLVWAQSWLAQRASIQTQKGKPRRLNGQEFRMERTPVHRSGGGGPTPLMGLACQSNRAKSRLVQAHDINSCAARRKSAAGLAPTALPPQAFSLLPRNTRPVSFCPRHPRPHRRRIR